MTGGSRVRSPSTDTFPLRSIRIAREIVPFAFFAVEMFRALQLISSRVMPKGSARLRSAIFTV
jgi:hypothetical protein